MTQPFDDEHGERLRRALHAEAEAVTPSAEGLERIRSKINERHERRLGLVSYSAPWLRPLAAVTAALAVCIVAVSVTPGLANLVQTGHFSPDSGGDGGGAMQNDGHSPSQVVPGESSGPVPSAPPSPSSIHPSSPGKHVVRGSCPPGENTVRPSSPPPSTAPKRGAAKRAAAKITCQAPPVSGGTSSSAPATEPPPPPTSSTPDQPPGGTGSESAPAPQSNPKTSP